MSELSILFQEMEVSDRYFEYEMSTIQLNTEVFTEDGDGKDGFFTKLKKAVCDFIDKIIKSIQGVFEKFSTSKACKNAENAMAVDPSIKNQKAKMTDWKKVHVLNKATRKKIEAAKSKEEVDKIMRDYRAKRNKIIAATTAVTVTVGTVLLFLKKGKGKTVQNMEEQKQDMKYESKTSPEPVKPSGPVTPAAPKTEEVKKAKATADAEIRKSDVKDSADEVKQCTEIISDDAAKALMDKMNKSAIRTPKDPSPKRKNNDKITNDHDKAINRLNRYSNRIRAMEKMLDDPSLMSKNHATKENIKDELNVILDNAKEYRDRRIAPGAADDIIAMAEMAIAKA